MIEKYIRIEIIMVKLIIMMIVLIMMMIMMILVINHLWVWKVLITEEVIKKILIDMILMYIIEGLIIISMKGEGLILYLEALEVEEEEAFKYYYSLFMIYYLLFLCLF